MCLIVDTGLLWGHTTLVCAHAASGRQRTDCWGPMVGVARSL